MWPGHRGCAVTAGSSSMGGQPPTKHLGCDLPPHPAFCTGHPSELMVGPREDSSFYLVTVSCGDPCGFSPPPEPVTPPPLQPQRSVWAEPDPGQWPEAPSVAALMLRALAGCFFQNRLPAGPCGVHSLVLSPIFFLSPLSSCPQPRHGSPPFEHSVTRGPSDSLGF